MRLAFYEKGKEFFENYYNIGYFQWEYEFVDPKFKNDLSLCDEIWGISDFVTKSLKQLNIDVPHKTCLIPVKVGTTKFKRENYNFPNNKKIFFYAFDFNSSLERKNPQALIDAFQLAFKNHLKNDILLVLKVHSPSKKNKDYIKFKNLIANDDRIFLVEDLLSYSEMIGLVNAVDVVVSLHRSEGYGMLMHEAQLLGKYVIATGYSANIEFMQGHKKSFLVDYKIIPKNDNKKYFWANPDINDAASKLMLVYDLIKD